MSPVFHHRDPDTAYRGNNLLLPRSRVNEKAVKNALEFTVGTEEVIDPVTEEYLGVKAKILRLWDETAAHLIVPRDFIRPQDRDKYDFPWVQDPIPDFEEINFEVLTSPRDNIQEQAIEALTTSQEDGVLNLSCGYGKTAVSLMAAAQFKVPIIVVVNSKDLMAQWREEIQTHLSVDGLPPEVGVIQGSTQNWERPPVVIAMVQSLSAHRDEWPMRFRTRFGVTIFDEAHHMSAPVFVQAADLFFGKRMALTATASRTDGMEAIYQYHLGRVSYRYLKQELVPQTRFHVLTWAIPDEDMKEVQDVLGDVNTSKVRGYLGQLGWRNSIIEGHLQKDIEAGRQILVLSHSVDHVKELASRFGEHNYITGGVSDGSERRRVLQESNPVFGTFQLAREALNKPKLDTLYITTPFGNPNDMQQSWGRIQRKLEGKNKTLVRVYEDVVTRQNRKPTLQTCAKSCRNLRKFLKALNYPSRRDHIRR